MTTTTAFTQKEKILQYLNGTGRTLTAAQARNMWDVRNLRARMTEIRQDGLTVETFVNTRGNTAYKIAPAAAPARAVKTAGKR